MDCLLGLCSCDWEVMMARRKLSGLPVTATVSRCECAAVSMSLAGAGWKCMCSAAVRRAHVFMHILVKGKWHYSPREEALNLSPFFSMSLSVLRLLWALVLQCGESMCRINSGPRGESITAWRIKVHMWPDRLLLLNSCVTFYFFLTSKLRFTLKNCLNGKKIDKYATKKSVGKYLTQFP